MPVCGVVPVGGVVPVVVRIAADPAGGASPGRIGQRNRSAAEWTGTVHWFLDRSQLMADAAAMTLVWIDAGSGAAPSWSRLA